MIFKGFFKCTAAWGGHLIWLLTCRWFKWRISRIGKCPPIVAIFWVFRPGPLPGGVHYRQADWVLKPLHDMLYAIHVHHILCRVLFLFADCGESVWSRMYCLPLKSFIHPTLREVRQPRTISFTGRNCRTGQVQSSMPFDYHVFPLWYIAVRMLDNINLFIDLAHDSTRVRWRKPYLHLDSSKSAVGPGACICYVQMVSSSCIKTSSLFRPVARGQRSIARTHHGLEPDEVSEIRANADVGTAYLAGGICLPSSQHFGRLNLFSENFLLNRSQRQRP